MLRKRGKNGQSPGQPIQAKVIYQYPKKSTFRSTVTSNDIDVGETPEAPAYLRKRRKGEVEQEVIEKSEKISKVSEKRFVPSEVPSPIYGYQKRKGSEKVENTPAFVRNRQNKVVQKHEQPSETEKLQITEADKDNSHSSKAEPLHVVTESIKENTQQEKKITPDHKETKKHTRQQKRQSSIKRKRNKPLGKGHHVPFNVMMTHNDKLHLDKRQQEKYMTKEKVVKKPLVDKQSIQPIPSHLLNDPIEKGHEDSIWVQNQRELLEQTLKHFNVKAKVVHATQGPSITRFEVQPELGVKVSRIRNLNDDIKLNMSAKDIRIEAPIPGKNTVGIEIPNLNSQTVGLQEILEADSFRNSESPLTIGLGLTVEGNPLVTNVSKMPHGLIAGATGSGKSVCINTILISLLYKSSHEDVKMLLIDPKMVELAPYNGIPHLVAPVITDVKAATAALKWAVNEMEDRYDRFVQEGVRDITRYNEKVIKQGRTKEKMPFMVIVIDELADLMMVSPQEVEDSICRIAQKARACGMHLLLATQRPSVDVITGLIKANIPTRIAFSVSSQIDSRTIIDTSGAERLLGKGDMLFVENGSGKNVRLQGAFVSDEEIDRITNHARIIAQPHYLFEQEQLLNQLATDEDKDELLDEVIQFVIRKNQASTSLLQRQFRIGYNRAARLIDTLENKGIVSGQSGSKPRDVLLSEIQVGDTH